MTSPARTLITLLSICIFGTAAHAGVTVTKNQFRARAFLTAGSSISTTESGTTIPTVPDPLHVDAVNGEAYSKNVINWSAVVGQTVFSFDSNLKRIGVVPSAANVDQFALEFMVDENSAYDLSGYLDVTDVGETESGYVLQAAQLYDSSAGLILFSGLQESISTHDERFTLGGMGGDDTNSIWPSGSQTGTLLAGHTYSLVYHYMIGAISSNSGASAVGNFTLKISTVPEPPCVALCTVFASLGLIRLRKIG